MKRFFFEPNLHLKYGDSRKLLKLRKQKKGNKNITFFYLDAHWYNNLPLKDEVRFILTHWDEAVICIDDFVVDDDPGYKFDRYKGISLSLEYLDFIKEFDIDKYFPAVSSIEETGNRKSGSVYLVKGKKMRKTIKECLPKYLRLI